MPYLCLMFLMIFSATADAHRLKLFVKVDGSTLAGYAYFSAARRAQNITVERFLVGEQTPIDRQITNERGEFRFERDPSARYRLVADDGSGHRAEWQQPAASPEPALPTAPANPATELTPLLAQQLEAQFTHQFNELRETLAQYEDRRRWQDLIGGLGYIAGIFGALAWLMRR